MFHVARDAEIKAGRVADVYFTRTQAVLEARGIDHHGFAEVTLNAFPGGFSWGIFAGVEEVARLLEGLPVHVDAVEEGTPFFTQEPLLTIEGPYRKWGHYETAILGLLCQASGIATKAARCRKAAAGRPVVSFGARRMHPAIATMIERNAFLGGCDGVAVVASAELIGETPIGTMPHALILLLGDTVTAARAFDEVIPPTVPRVVLIDTLADERFEAVRVAEALGERLHGVRLDTPSSRRGDMAALLREVRWELDRRGFQRVKLFVSGGLDEAEIQRLNPIADAYGVGTAISNAPVMDFALDLVEVNGRPLAKRGKLSGRKVLTVCPRCCARRLDPEPAAPTACRCGERLERLLRPLLQNGKIVRDLPSPQVLRNRVITALDHLSV